MNGKLAIYHTIITVCLIINKKKKHIRFYLPDEFCHLPTDTVKEINWHIGRQLLFCQSFEIRFKITIVCSVANYKFSFSSTFALYLHLYMYSWLINNNMLIVICFVGRFTTRTNFR